MSPRRKASSPVESGGIFACCSVRPVEEATERVFVARERDEYSSAFDSLHDPGPGLTPIQKLIIAEKEGAERIEEARQFSKRKIDEARKEAAREGERYQARYRHEIQRMADEIERDIERFEAQQERHVEKHVIREAKRAEANQKRARRYLMEHVCTVQLGLSTNAISQLRREERAAPCTCKLSPSTDASPLVDVYTPTTASPGDDSLYADSPVTAINRPSREVDGLSPIKIAAPSANRRHVAETPNGKPGHHDNGPHLSRRLYSSSSSSSSISLEMDDHEDAGSRHRRVPG